MAIVSQGFELIVSFADNGGKPYMQRTYGLKETDPTNIPTVVAAVIPEIQAVTDAVIAQYRVAEVFVEDALTLPAITVQNENQAIITAPITGAPNKSGTVTIPAAKASLFVGTSGKNANIVKAYDQAPLAAFLSEFGDGAEDQFYVSDGETLIVAQSSGKRRHTKNPNG